MESRNKMAPPSPPRNYFVRLYIDAALGIYECFVKIESAERGIVPYGVLFRLPGGYCVEFCVLRSYVGSCGLTKFRQRGYLA
jgi:hypothetical protein